MRTAYGQIATHAGSDARCILSSVSGHASEQSVSMPQDEALSVALVLSDGGSFSNEYSASNVFVDDGSVYCSVSVEGVNLVARCSSSFASAAEGPSPSSSGPGSNNSPFTLTSIVVRVPPSGFTSPLGQAIIFTSWDFPDLEAIKCFDSVRSQHDYDRLAGTCSSSGNSSSSGRSSRDEMEVRHAADHPDTPSSSSGSEMQVHPAADPADSPSSSSDDSMDEELFSDREQQVAHQLAWLLTGQGGPLPLPQSQDQDQGLLGQCDWAPWLPGLPPPPSLLRQPPSVVTMPAMAMLPPWTRAARGALPSMPKDLPVSDSTLPVPRLFIDMGASLEARFILPSPASGRFVVVKMLRSSSSGADNIDVQYIGLRGLTRAPRFAAGVVL